MNTDLASKLIDSAIRKGADEAEAYVRTSKSLAVEVREQKIDTLESSLTMGYGIRVIRDRRLGFSFSNDTAKIDEVIEEAVESSKYTEPDEYLGLPAPAASRPRPPRIFDERIESLAEDDAISAALLIEKSALETDSRVKRVRKASAGFGKSDTCIMSSKGINACYASTWSSAKITVLAEEDGENQIGWDYEGSRFLKDVSFGQVGRNGARRALQLLGARNINPVKGFVLLDSSVSVEFLEILSSALSSDSVQKKRSMLEGKTGELVISPKLNITDNGLLDGLLGSRPVDAEGVPTTGKVLIGKGVLNGFLYNTYTARKDGVQSTGNAVRGGPAGIPSVGPTNLFLEPSSGEYAASFGQLVKAVDKGLYIIETMGMHTANPISGEFSVGVSGLWIENGEVRYPVKEAAVSGNVLELFKNTLMVGDNLRFYGNIGAPSLLIEGVDISG